MSALPQITAAKLARTMRYCAEHGRVAGLHPDELRAGATYVEELEAELELAYKALKAGDHHVDIVVKRVPGFLFEIDTTMALISPRQYESHLRLEMKHLDIYGRDYLTYLGPKIVALTIKPWVEELNRKAIDALAQIDFMSLPETPRG